MVVAVVVVVAVAIAVVVVIEGFVVPDASSTLDAVNGGGGSDGSGSDGSGDPSGASGVRSGING